MSGLSGICLEMLLSRRPTEAMGRRINRRAWSGCLLTGWPGMVGEFVNDPRGSRT